MTIALIAIPHQTPARIHWFRDRNALEDAAINDALNSDRHEPTDFDEAVQSLSDDWHRHILLESATDLYLIVHYEGHQKHRVRYLLEELEDEFLPAEADSYAP